MKPTSRFLQGMILGLIVAALPILVHANLWPLILVSWILLCFVLRLEWKSLSCELPVWSYTSAKEAYVNEPFVLKIQIDWKTQLSLQALLHLEVTEPFDTPQDKHTLFYPGSNQLELELSASRRGSGELHALWVRLDGPYGLLSRTFRLECEEPQSFAVTPSLPRVRAIALQHFGALQMQGGVRLERMRGDGSEFDALEAYVSGHDPRSVDWKASARHQKLTVQRFRVERNQRIVFCLDTGRLMSEPIGVYQRLDHAIHASLLLSYFALRAGDLVGLYTYDQEPGVWLPPVSNMRNFKRMHRVSSDVFAHDVETNHVLGLHKLLTQLKRRTLVVVFSDFTHSTTAELMIERLESLVRKHLVIFVALDDPILEHPLKVQPESAEHVARAIVSSDLRIERHKVFKRLQRAGVHIVHGPPEAATIQLVARYTEIKRRELIG